MTDTTDTTTRPTTRPTDATTRPSRPTGRYPTDEEDAGAPLVPYIRQPTEESELTSLRREVAGLRDQLNRIERAMQTPTDTQ